MSRQSGNAADALLPVASRRSAAAAALSRDTPPSATSAPVAARGRAAVSRRLHAVPLLVNNEVHATSTKLAQAAAKKDRQHASHLHRVIVAFRRECIVYTFRAAYPRGTRDARAFKTHGP
jgi:hypothetical protein